MCFKGGWELKISSQEVEYVAHLARLEVTDQEKEKFTAQLNDILLYIDKLNELDTKGVAPMSHAMAVTNAFREDRIVESIGTEKSLTNAPDARGEFFRVPKVID
jgi:aspartyl-tRNA(Asn)/glutamyl-tRNA(Gln) amidotransferase subunit C